MGSSPPNRRSCPTSPDLRLSGSPPIAPRTPEATLAPSRTCGTVAVRSRAACDSRPGIETQTERILMDTEAKQNAACDDAKPGKQSYEVPRLIVHGTIEQITGALGGGGTDGVMGSLIG